LCILNVCGYNIEKTNAKLQELYNREVTLDKNSILTEISQSQNEEGKISSQNFDSENDVRFFYCACAIHKLLGVEKQEDYFINIPTGLKYLDSLEIMKEDSQWILLWESNGS
jgi:prenyltransferase beta subunit